MEIETKFYGTIDLEQPGSIFFSQGIPGFENERRFIIIEPDNSVFQCLQSLDHPEIAFIVISPFLICPDYSFSLPEDVSRQIRLFKLEDALVLGVVTIPHDNPRTATINLQAPVVINLKEGLGCQVILINESYPMRLSIWDKKE
jgi:flagellar assembly factor FliW